MLWLAGPKWNSDLHPNPQQLSWSSLPFSETLHLSALILETSSHLSDPTYMQTIASSHLVLNELNPCLSCPMVSNPLFHILIPRSSLGKAVSTLIVVSVALGLKSQKLTNWANNQIHQLAQCCCGHSAHPIWNYRFTNICIKNYRFTNFCCI